ncbi:tyrosine-type recombinase/integrase [Halomarina rubra]|uniref:Tyrosine-type recombinase/integrase n=1 Tax=Halomarina rubra TaxID=2071873 RepID=A0ABD6B0W5_9EURY
MRLDDYNEKDGKRVWLTAEELEQFIEAAKDPQQRVAFMLGGKAGLRRSEITSVTPNDFNHGPPGFVRVWSDYAKRDKYREAPIPTELEHIVSTLSHGEAPDEPVVDVAGTTVYRWVRRAAEAMHAETNDKGWSFLDVHDLRRSWGGHLLWNCGVLPTVVMEFGGWTDWDTFTEHYMGEITPEAAQRERGKIDYMGGESNAETDMVFTPKSPAAQQTYMRN